MWFDSIMSWMHGVKFQNILFNADMVFCISLINNIPLIIEFSTYSTRQN